LTAQAGEVCFSDIAHAGPGSLVVFERHLSFASADMSLGQGAFICVRLFIVQIVNVQRVMPVDAGCPMPFCLAWGES